MMRVTESSPKSILRRFRFRLVDLLLLLTLFACWLPYGIGRHRAAALRAENESLKRFADVVFAEESSKFSVVRLVGNRHESSTWKVFVPPTADCELRMANEGISHVGFPPEFDRVPLTPGEHQISILQPDDEFSFKVFVDSKLVMQSRFPNSWIESGGGTHTTSGNTLEYFGIREPIKLLTHCLSERLRGFDGESAHTRKEQANKGACLWIAPSDMEHKPLPIFVSPDAGVLGGGSDWGFRRGLRVRVKSGTRDGDDGMIQLIHTESKQAQDVPLNTLAVKVRGIGQQSFSSSATEKVEGSKMRFVAARWKEDPRRYALSDFPGSNDELRFFIHMNVFNNGVQPVVEVLFKADQPNRVGFRIQTAVGSAPIADCFLSASACRFAQLRELTTNDGVLTPQDVFATRNKSDSCKLLSSSRFPLVEADQLRRVQLTTDADYPSVSYPQTVSRPWRYIGYAATQNWLFPADSDVTVAIGREERYPGSNGPIPGGPCFENVELRAPFHYDQWVWFELVPSNSTDSEDSAAPVSDGGTP